MTTTTLPGDEGERRRDAAHALLAAHRAVYVRRGRRALLEQLLLSGTASADDVRALVRLPDGIDPRCLGPVPGPLRRARIIRRADYMPSHRPERHASIIAVWQLADRAAACDWLGAHPDLPDVEPGPKQATLFG